MYVPLDFFFFTYVEEPQLGRLRSLWAQTSWSGAKTFFFLDWVPGSMFHWKGPHLEPGRFS